MELLLQQNLANPEQFILASMITQSFFVVEHIILEVSGRLACARLSARSSEPPPCLLSLPLLPEGTWLKENPALFLSSCEMRGWMRCSSGPQLAFPQVSQRQVCLLGQFCCALTARDGFCRTNGTLSTATTVSVLCPY